MIGTLLEHVDGPLIHILQEAGPTLSIVGYEVRLTAIVEYPAITITVAKITKDVTVIPSPSEAFLENVPGPDQVTVWAT